MWEKQCKNLFVKLKLDVNERRGILRWRRECWSCFDELIGLREMRRKDILLCEGGGRRRGGEREGEGEGTVR
jgi:hypothetical protein